MNERERRLFLAEVSIKFGYGSTSILSERTGVSISTIRRGIAELASPTPLEDSYVRKPGAGRKPVEETYPEIVKEIREILEDETYGSPEGGKWTSCSLRSISNKLRDKDIVVEKSTVQRIVKELGSWYNFCTYVSDRCGASLDSLYGDLMNIHEQHQFMRTFILCELFDFCIGLSIMSI